MFMDNSESLSAEPSLASQILGPVLGTLMFREPGARPDGTRVLPRMGCEYRKAGDRPLLTPLSKDNKERFLTWIQPTNERIWPILFYVNSESLPTF